MAGRVGGRIIRIKLQGFLTFDDLEINPDKGLNLIVGLNGSGKSSIMSAICLGLGGKPQFTGRSFQLPEFIKSNHTEAKVEIELECPRGRNDVIRRVIQVNKQIWYLNDKLVNQNEIASVIKKYNIDMGNLCQFLPQEKVSEFSKMDKKQRLVDMIHAIGDPNLVTLFDELKELRNNLCHLENALKEQENNKISEETMNERLRPEIESQEERLKLEYELRLLKQEKTSYEYKIFRKKVRTCEKEIKKLSKEISEIEKQSNELETLKTSHSSQLHIYQTKVEELKGEIYKCIQNLIQHYESLRACHEEVDNAKIYFKNRIKERTEQMTKLTTLSKQIKDLKGIQTRKEDDMARLKEKVLENTKEYENVKRQLSSCDSDMEKLKLNKASLEYKKRSNEEEIDRMSNEENKKYEVLRQNYPDAYTALQWLQTNESSFSAGISHPPLVSIKVQNEDHHKFIESTVNVRDLLVFVCEDKEDFERFVQIMIHEKKLSVNVALVPDESLADFSSHPVTNDMRNLGIRCYLKDLFSAPDLVMRYLCKLSGVHKVPVCDESAEGHIDAILEYNNLFYTASKRISGKRSQYGQKSMSVKRDDLVRKNVLPDIKDNSEALLSAKRDLQDVERMLEECKPQLDALKRQRTQLERQQEQLRKEKTNVNAEIRKLNETDIKLAQFTDSYERTEKEVINEEEEEKKVADTIHNLNAKKLEILEEIYKIVKEIVNLKKEKAVSILHMKCFKEKISYLEVKILTVEVRLNSIKSHLSMLQSTKSQCSSEATKLYEKINAPGQSSMALTFPMHSLEEIEQQISNIEAQLQLTDEDITAVMAEHKKREKKILQIEEQINSLKTEIEGLKIRMQEKKGSWLPPLKTHIESVNKKFSEYYKNLECAGEISLNQTDDTDDFPNYGLHIKLKYRADEELTELSQTQHSGGECSVAAIIFILSLQELTDVPFRCIDEINQGMDAKNEREIYQLVADAARNGPCSQYFLLTPKMLMDLSFDKNVAVHVIFNSHFLQAKLNVKEHLKIAKTCRR